MTRVRVSNASDDTGDARFTRAPVVTYHDDARRDAHIRDAEHYAARVAASLRWYGE